MKVVDGQPIFLKESEEIDLDSSETMVIRYVRCEKLFKNTLTNFRDWICTFALKIHAQKYFLHWSLS